MKMKPLQNLLTLIFTLLTSGLSMKVTKSYKIDGWVMDAIIINGYVVSEYVGFLKFALLDEEPGFNLETYTHYLNEEHLQIYSLAPDPKNSAVLVGGSSKYVKSYEMKPGTEGTFLREWELPNESFYPQVLVMRKIPNTDAVLASCDNVTMSVLDLDKNNTFLKKQHHHHLDLVKELEIGGNFYLASGVQRYLVYNDWTNGNHLRLFTTNKLDREGGTHRVNGLAYLDLENDRDFFAIGADNSRIYIYETEHQTVVERFDDDNELLIDMIHLDQTEYLMVNAYDKLIIHHIFSSQSKIVFKETQRIISRIFQHGDQVLLIGEFGSLNVLDLEDTFCNRACKTCSKSIIPSACSACNDGFELVGTTCKTKCNTAGQVWTGSACQGKCTTGQFKRNKHLCSNCHATCKTCLLNSELSCLSCGSSLPLYTVNGTCATECGFGSAQLSNECKACPKNCKICSALSIGECTECKNSSFQLGTTHQCYDTCEVGEYLDDRTNECHYCGFGCLECWGFHPGQCWKCVPGFKIYNNSCWDKCPEDTFEIFRENRCERCDDNCKVCQGLDVCMECSPGYILDVMTNTCLTNCTDKGKYFLPPSYCEMCPYGCDACDIQGCSECAKGFTMNGNFCQEETKAPKFSNFMMFIVILLGVLGSAAVYYFTKKQFEDKQKLMKTVYNKVKNENQEMLRQAGTTAQNELNYPREHQLSEVSYQEEGDDNFSDVFADDSAQDSQIRSKNNPYGD